MPIKRVEPLRLGQLLGSLMGAAIDAQAQAARASVAFVEDVGFIDGPDGQQRLRTVSVRYHKKDENGETAEFEVEVPLLAMVNVPSLAVRDATFSMAYDVVTATAAEEPTKPSILTGLIRKKTSVSDRTTTTTSVDVDVTIAQESTPVGIERLFDLAELGITEEAAERDE